MCYGKPDAMNMCMIHLSYLHRRLSRNRMSRLALPIGGATERPSSKRMVDTREGQRAMKDGLRLYHRLLTFVAGMSFCAVAGAANEPSTLCAIPENPGIVTTCFFDLTKPPSSSQARADVLSGGLFRVPAADGELDQGFNGVLQSFVRIQGDGNGGTNASGISTAGYDTTAGGDIPKVTVCDGSGTGAN